MPETFVLPRSGRYTVEQLQISLALSKGGHPLVCGPDRDTLSPAEYRRWFLRCLHAKINRHGRTGNPRHPSTPYGRNDGGDGYMSDDERHTYQTAGRVNTPRLIVRPGEVPYRLRERLRDRITWPEEE